MFCGRDIICYGWSYWVNIGLGNELLMIPNYFLSPEGNAGLILGLHPAIERRYYVTPSLIDWAQN